MIRIFLVIIFVILLVGLGGVYYLKLSHKTPTTMELAANKKSLHDLLLTPNQMCTFQVNDENSGTLYASDAAFRVDFNEGKITKSHMISDLTNVFLWFDGKDIGIRVGWPISLENSELDVIAAKILDLGIKVESQCSPWKVDNSKFELPDIDFKDFGKKIPGTINEKEMTPEEKAKCDACNNLDQKEVSICRRNLECDDANNPSVQSKSPTPYIQPF